MLGRAACFHAERHCSNCLRAVCLALCVAMGVPRERSQTMLFNLKSQAKQPDGKANKPDRWSAKTHGRWQQRCSLRPAFASQVWKLDSLPVRTWPPTEHFACARQPHSRAPQEHPLDPPRRRVHFSPAVVPYSSSASSGDTSSVRPYGNQSSIDGAALPLSAVRLILDGLLSAARRVRGA